jgi:hypothetical protein
MPENLSGDKNVPKVTNLNGFKHRTRGILSVYVRIFKGVTVIVYKSKHTFWSPPTAEWKGRRRWASQEMIINITGTEFDFADQLKLLH